MVELGALLQAGAVFFGTVIAAPLLSGDNKRHRFYGFATMLVGNSFALILHIDLSLWIMSAASIFWGLMSIRGLWLNRPQPSDNLPQTILPPVTEGTVDLIPGE